MPSDVPGAALSICPRDRLSIVAFLSRSSTAWVHGARLMTPLRACWQSADGSGGVGQ